ncbi:MAG TPA: metallophosphoesterase [Ramlibacter sp.]|nr:metallophosphoesterase [Ramlibacter sp.]
MRLGVLSDLHLSRAPQALPANDADAYVLAGDLGRPDRAIPWAASLGKPVLYVPGNHEFYGGSLPGVVRELRRLAEGTQVRVLDNEEACIGPVRFLGSTLWSDFLLDGDGEGRDVAVREALAHVHDFRRIFCDEARQAVFTPLESAALFRRNAEWLRTSLQRAWPGPTVVVTHHAPSARSVHPRFAGSPLNACFASHLDELLGSDKAALWIHGHMHHSVDYQVRGTRVLCNPRGYVTADRCENPDFDPDCSVEIA